MFHNMFLVKDQDLNNLVYTPVDPRKDGYSGELETGVDVDYDLINVHEWPYGKPRPEICVGQAPNNPKLHKVFKYDSERQEQGYSLVPGKPLVFGDWAEYALLRNPLVFLPKSATNFLHYEFDAGVEDELEATLVGGTDALPEGHANVLLLDDANFRNYQAGRPYGYADGGFAAKSVVHLYPPQQGHWHVIIDLGGYSGEVRAAVRKVTAQQIAG